MQFSNSFNQHQVFWLKAKQCVSTVTLTQILPPRRLPGQSNHLKYSSLFNVCDDDAKKWCLNSGVMKTLAGLWTVNAPMVSMETFSSSPTSHRATTWPLSSVRYILDFTQSLFFWALFTFF